jgi:carbonic anhydrase
MEKILKGVIEFHNSITEHERPKFAKLVAEGQSPRALFITCADSRIVPNEITHTDPGDLFLIRNIGNLIPPYHLVQEGLADTSVAAALEYSLEYLKIKNIIVCGHSDCGAMKAVRRYKDLPQETPLRRWLSSAEGAIQELLAGRAIDDTLSTQNQLAQLNVLAQIAHLKQYPWVRERLETGELMLHGWFLRIETADVQVYHPGRNRFVHIDDETVAELRFFNQLLDKVPGVRMNLHDAEAFLSR